MATTDKKQDRKDWLSRLFTAAWQFRKMEKLSFSKALRKAWVLYTTLQKDFRFSPSMFDFASVDIVCKSEYVGSLQLLDEGYVNARNRIHSSKIFKNRHEAITFALSTQKSKAIAQLPLL